jgi:hypothetical protein
MSHARTARVGTGLCRVSREGRAGREGPDGGGGQGPRGGRAGQGRAGGRIGGDELARGRVREPRRGPRGAAHRRGGAGQG